MRNVVLITWDSVRADHCSCYGYKNRTTPFLEKIAKKGVLFENAIVSGVPTPYSMGGIFTGKHNLSGRIKSRTLSEILKNKGFKTLAFHSNPYASRFFGFDRGFTVFKDYVWMDEKGYKNEHSGVLKKVVTDFLSKFKFIDMDRIRFYYNILLVLIKNKYDVGLNLNDYYIDILNSIRTVGEPFFLWILLIETHFPYAPLNWSRIKKIKSMLIYDRYYRLGGVQKHVNLNLDKNKLRLVLNAYDDCIKEADNLTKKLWNDLKDYDPVFIIHADHGDAFGEHGFFGHPPEHYEYLIRVPLVIYNADVSGRIREPVSLLRIAPTVCELLNIKNEFKNRNLFDNENYSPPIVLNKLAEGYRITVRDREWKLIIHPTKDKELFNIKTDNSERYNIIYDNKDIANDLETYVNKFLKTLYMRDKIKMLSKKI